MSNLFLNSLTLFAPRLNAGTIVAIVLILFGIFGYQIITGWTIAYSWLTGGKRQNPVILQSLIILVGIVTFFISSAIENIVYSPGTWIIIMSITILLVAFLLIFGDNIFGKRK
jgi:hypothetical protein